MVNNISILTLVHKRENALRNTLTGVAKGSVLPQEVIVVYMNESPYDLPEYPFTVRSVSLVSKNDKLNLAEARNTAMASSDSPLNIFLDVDCIPEKELVARYLNALRSDDILWSGRVRYLSQHVAEISNWEKQLLQLSSPDPVRAAQIDFPYELFWSLNFACSKKVFAKIGGFDPRYCGYGAEDTDFAFQARQQGVRLGTLSATAFHQYHPSYSPPINHLQNIVCNARVFREKWRAWPMEGWLHAFKEKGLIEWDGEQIAVVRNPTDRELAVCLK